MIRSKDIAGVPESRAKGEPSDISPMAEYVWYEWLNFHDTSVNFPDSKTRLRRYMGTAIDIDPVMACKVLHPNG
jgi:hypothetical protein